jgi:hypothetical protein
MKWSVKGEWGILPFTVGMWHKMQPLVGLTGQVDACKASVVLNRRSRSLWFEASSIWLFAWQTRHLAS